MIILAIFLAQALAQQPSDQSPDQVDAKPYMFCLIESAKRADDHISDASTIARAIEGGCQDQLRDYLTALRQAEPDYMKDYVNGAVDDIRRNDSLKAVLAERQRRRPNSN